MPQGAAFLCQCLTAWYGLVNLGAVDQYASKGGATVLVHSAAGGVGLFACEIVKRKGGVVIATVGSKSKVKFLCEHAGLKPEQVIVRTSGGAAFGRQLDQALKSLDRDGLDVVFDSLAGPYFLPAYDRMNAMGRHIQFGAASMTTHGTTPNWLVLAWKWIFRPRLDPLEMIAENKAVIGFNLIWLWDRVDQLTDVLDEMVAFGFTPPHVGLTKPFHEANKALVEFQQGQTVGKVVLTVADDVLLDSSDTTLQLPSQSHMNYSTCIALSVAVLVGLCRYAGVF